MKAIHIALKDLRRMFSSAFFLAFGLVLPLATAAVFFFAFGGMSSDSGFEIASIPVVIANLDRAQGGLAAGDIVADVLENRLPELIRPSRADSASAARAAVDGQQAAVAVIIPEGLSAAVTRPDGRAAIELYLDPTLTVGPGIVHGIVRQVADVFAGSKIAVQVTGALLAGHGGAVDSQTLQDVATHYAAWAAESATGQSGTAALLDVRPPQGGSQGESSGMAAVLGQIMAGMMVFYVFFTGASAAESILQEDEDGTLPRLFTTPTSHSAILGGKFLSAFVLLLVQVVVLLVASSLVFGISWGPPILAGVVAIGLVVVAAGFGLLVTSLLATRRQAGIIYGGVLTVMGMIGMIGVFTAGMGGGTSPMSTVSLLVPHGWAVRAWQMLLAGGDASRVALPVAVMLAAGAIFFALGALRFRKRFA